ncbi:nucleophile aminohydrolase [Flagelloscypha sp. PMI_526]|nr:nucleophile aminohydrolase [Flagelloscypha sp. PMI_526]
MPLHLGKVDSPELIFQRYPSRKGVVFGTKGVVASSQPLVCLALVHSLGKLIIAQATSAGLEILNKGGNAADAAVAVSAALNVTEWQQSEALLKVASPNGHEMLLNGKAPLPGQLMKLPNLAETFRTLAASGRDAFYKGRVAQAIVDLIQSQGGVMTMHDLESHKTTLVEPISIEYGSDIRIYECPPNGQGLTALLALGVLEALQVDGRIRPLNEIDHNSPEYLHILIESLRVAFADTLYYVTDPEVETIPLTELLSKEYLKKRSELIDINKTNPKVVHGSPVQSSDTVYFTATDQWGNACSMIQSNYAGKCYILIISCRVSQTALIRFCIAIPKGCGFTLQNRGTGFSLTPGHPNALKVVLVSPTALQYALFITGQGGKRPYHTIIPSIVTKDDNLFMTFGVMAGFMQVCFIVVELSSQDSQLSMLLGSAFQQVLPDSKETQDINPINSEVYVEEGIPVETVEKLIAMGHDARVAGGFNRATFGRGQVIQKLQNEDSLVWAAGV